MENVRIYKFVMKQFEKPDCPRYPEIAEGSKVSRRTVEKIARREILDPGVSHIEKLAEYFVRFRAKKTRAAA